MKIQTNEIHNHSMLSFQIEADVSLYETMVEDMLENAGDFAPRSVWQKLENAADIDNYKPNASRYVEEVLSYDEMRKCADDLLKQYPNLEDLLDSWIGPRGRRDEFDPQIINDFREYISEIDDCNMMDCLLGKECYKLQTDMSTVAEVAIINNLTKNKTSVNVLEIGGGYGRLCEGLMNVYGNQMRYILADSVPISLMYSYLFLRQNLPDLRIGIYYLDQDPDFSQYECFIIPTWYLEKTIEENELNFDLAINIQSMQEMSQWHVDHYLRLFDEKLVQDGLVYLNNNKQYIFRGQWNYPSNWSLLFRHQTPWSWSIDCPTEVFRKTMQVQTENNWLISYGHNQMVSMSEKITQLSQSQHRLLKLYKDSEENLKLLKASLKKCEENIDALKDELEEKNIVNMSLQNQVLLQNNELDQLNCELVIKDNLMEEKLLLINSQKKQIEEMLVFIAKVQNSMFWKLRSMLVKE